VHGDEEHRRRIHEQVPPKLVAHGMEPERHRNREEQKGGARTQGARDEKEHRPNGLRAGEQGEMRMRSAVRMDRPADGLDAPDEQCHAERPPEKEKGA
jgi:hypothetical protein